ncbi:MAG: ribose-phosphate pyrophosphokinase [Candidatus Omnitrophica bacterium]|nr:ribose-phosphate pyrophosphokinase [Candidatus Omnitrophota bacterium]MCF7877000.1 ribose-phosphate pyrophosphokinase [Candidatus Omnitrophota bacterium]MCF7878520.1 ribose-phosphate pyrophosphokinase [Candidatus Omnitrophota bacterium]
MDKLVVFSGSSNRSLSEKICRKLDTKLAKAKISRFSDGEVSIQLEENVRGKDVFLIQSTCPPVNENLMELLVMLDAARRASAQRITAVIPYFGYARQDRKDRPRVPITAKLAANILASSGANRVLTLDLHAGQIQGFFDIPLDHLYAINVFFEYFKQNKIKDLVIVSPDVGGIKMARAYAKRFGADLAIVDKRRKSPESTEVMHILGDVEGKNVLLVDDIIATGSSLVNGAAALKKQGAKNIFAAISHGILSNNAVDKIKNSRIDSLVITDSIPLPEEKKREKIKVVSLDSLFADAIKRIHFEKSISVLFDTTGS